MDAEADDSGNRSLDETDVRILQMLEANGRATYEEIARLVNLSANAVRGRVQAMTRRRVIRGIHADVDWAGGGPKIEALLDIRLRPGADDAQFERSAVAIPGAGLPERRPQLLAALAERRGRPAGHDPALAVPRGALEGRVGRAGRRRA